MAIQRWDPLRDLMALHDRINRLFEESIARSGGLRSAEAPAASSWTPPVDLYEEPGRFVLRTDVPGVPGGAIALEVQGGELLLRGAKTAENAVPKDAYLRMERPSGGFVLRLAIPESVDRSAIQASCRDGVLEVVLPKKHDEAGAGRFTVPVK
jgi:HSP20 family protein